MKFYLEVLKLIFNIFVLKMSNGEAIKIFAKNNGIAYIKLAQILANQHYGNLFTEKDRKDLETICDSINPIPYSEIKKILEEEYGNLDDIFISISEDPIGAASISQVHKGVLKDGSVVAIKVKRKDITSTLENDLKTMKEVVTSYINFLRKHKHIQKFIEAYFPIFNLNNLAGFNKAFLMYYKWILEETDFEHEEANIKDYQKFADQVNGKVPNTVSIVLPKLYEELSRDNVIIMEYIPYPNFNHTNDDEGKIKALNSYLELSFYAMFNNIDVYFHGDPHSGNLYLDNNGNIGFLDMGLLFHLSAEDLKLTKDFFLAAYSKNKQKLFNLLISFADLTQEEKKKFQEEVNEFCDNINSKTVTEYFTDMITICLKYDIAPPNFLFCMAKAFVSLNGISYLANNDTTAFQLLEKQTLEYLLAENLKNMENMGIRLLNLSPTIIQGGTHFLLHKTLPNAFLKEVQQELKNEETRKALNDALDFLHLLRVLTNDSLGR